jgi:tRNA (adenine37-N6)-methyltransferase
VNEETITPIGTVHSTRRVVKDDHWDREKTYIELDPSRFDAEALAGLDTFSHAEILFLFDRVDPAGTESGSRHPRDNPDWPKVGIFAQRGKNRPNRVGATICRIERVEGPRLYVAGLDAVDGTPVLDIKPWIIEFGPRGPVSQPRWVSELMKDYWSDQA